MHKGFPPSELLIKKDETLIFLSVSLYRGGRLANLKIKSERSEKLGENEDPQILLDSFSSFAFFDFLNF
jgi:hypothetical protein